MGQGTHVGVALDVDYEHSLKPPLHVETFSRNLCATANETSFTKGFYTVKLLFFSPLRPLRAVAEVENGFTFRETCLATHVRKSFAQLSMLHGATPAETCFAVPLHTSFS